MERRKEHEYENAKFIKAYGCSWYGGDFDSWYETCFGCESRQCRK